jgi:hypothetical protein
MRPIKAGVMVVVALAAMPLIMSLTGCAVDVGYGPDEPEWDGQLVVVGGGDRGYDRDHHPQAFRADEHRPAAVGSARGRASMGARAGGGGGHAPSGGGRR